MPMTIPMPYTPINIASTVVIVRTRCLPRLRKASLVLTFQLRGRNTTTRPDNEPASKKRPNTGSTWYTAAETTRPARTRPACLIFKRSGTGNLLMAKISKLKMPPSTSRYTSPPYVAIRPSTIFPLRMNVASRQKSAERISSSSSVKALLPTLLCASSRITWIGRSLAA